MIINHLRKIPFSPSHGEIMGSIPVWVMLRTTRSPAFRCWAFFASKKDEAANFDFIRKEFKKEKNDKKIYGIIFKNIVKARKKC